MPDEVKHTPGEWERFGTQVIHRVANRAGAMVPCPVAHVVVVHKGNCPGSKAPYHEQNKRAEAEAALFAAAPDLLTELGRSAHTLESCALAQSPLTDAEREHLRAVVALARRAIAKAEARS